MGAGQGGGGGQQACVRASGRSVPGGDSTACDTGLVARDRVEVRVRNDRKITRCLDLTLF